jgi:hypothetical protein
MRGRSRSLIVRAVENSPHVERSGAIEAAERTCSGSAEDDWIATTGSR